MYRRAGPSVSDWSRPRAFDERMTGAGQIQPIETIETRVAFEDALVRVEANRVRNAATQAEETVLRIVPASDSQHMVAIVPVLDDGRFLLMR